MPGSNPSQCILDTSAILRYLDREAGWQRVHFVLDQCSAGHCRVLVSAVNWGELAAKLCRDRGVPVQAAIMANLAGLGIEIVPVTAVRAENAGRIKARLKVPYADTFGIELALDSPHSVLITADFDAKPAAAEIQIEFLPVK